ncbi:hypothetical protein J6TS2_50900 [Heyndrickxia sporothermodurans]|nr:hypothetical protein J6TS2_50900 [Heyndrickxia sporothermodurans]
MAIKFKSKDGKHTLEARNEIQAAAFIKQGLQPATKADEKKLEGQEG